MFSLRLSCSPATERLQSRGFERFRTNRRMLCRIGLANLAQALCLVCLWLALRTYALLPSWREFSSPAARWPGLASGSPLKVSIVPGVK